MTRRYRVALPLTVHTADSSYTQGEEFDHDFSVEDEQANLASGLLELLPRRYKVVGASVVHDTAPGEEFERALPLGVEQMLIAGGHIEPVADPEPEPEERPARKVAKKAAAHPPTTKE